MPYQMVMLMKFISLRKPLKALLLDRFTVFINVNSSIVEELLLFIFLMMVIWNLL